MSVRSILPAVFVAAAGLALAGPASAGGWAGARGGPIGGSFSFHGPAPQVLGAVSAASHIKPVIVPHPMGFNGPIGLYGWRGRGGYAYGRRGGGFVANGPRVYGRNAWHGFNGPVWRQDAYGYGVWHRPHVGQFGPYHPPRHYRRDLPSDGYGYGYGGSVGGGYVVGGDYGNGVPIVNGVGVVGGASVYPVYGAGACGGGPAVYDLRGSARTPHRDPLVIYGIAPQC